MAEFDFPSTSLTDGQTHTENGVTFVWDNTNGAWKKNPASAIKGEPGTSVKGEPGASTKGEPGSDGSDGSSVKGEPGASTKGEPGASTKGEPGSDGSDGSDGDSVKGQKGEAGSSGSDAQLPVGTIVAYGGNSAPTGWQICNGGTASSSALQTVLGQTNVPNLENRFIIGAGDDYSRHNSGGSANAIVVDHSHTINNHTHGSGSLSVTGGNHNHQYIDQYSAINEGYRPWPASNNDCAQRNINTSGSGSHSHTVSGSTGNPSNRGTDSQGSSGTNANLPPYYALIYIIKT